MKRPPRILISAGETSGDRLGAGLAEALWRKRPEIEISGMGADRMKAAGVEILQDASEVAVVGIVEVLAHLPQLLGAMRRLRAPLAEGRTDLLVPVDYPDFNLRLTAHAHRAGVPVVYFVSPQVWAWRKGRVHKIKKLVRRMLVLFPFESSFYDEAGVPVTFVGHPSVEDPPRALSAASFHRATGLDPAKRTVALMPGSRRSEVGRLLPVLLAAAGRLRAAEPDLQFVLPVAPGLDDAWLGERIASETFQAVALHRGDFPGLLHHCVAGVVASGTASLEAALTGLPLVVVYRMAPLSYWIGSLLVDLQHIALPNLIAGKRLVPELIQGECDPIRICAEILRYLREPDYAERVRNGLLQVRQNLGAPGVFDRAADAVLEELDRPVDPG